MDSCSVSAKPGTDIWRKGPSVNIFNAPYQSLARKPLNAFASAELTVSLTPTAQYDQAGLLLILHPPHTLSAPQSVSQGPEVSDKYWIKTGMEYYDGQPRVSAVACKDQADWSIGPLEGAGKDVEIKMVARKQVDHHGSSLWIYKEGKAGLDPLREVCWVFSLGEGAASGWELEVAAFTARPNEEVSGELVAAFKDIKVEWV